MEYQVKQKVATHWQKMAVEGDGQISPGRAFQSFGAITEKVPSKAASVLQADGRPETTKDPDCILKLSKLKVIPNNWTRKHPVTIRPGHC